MGDEFLELPIHEIHATNKLNGDKLEVLLNEAEDKDWQFRRDLRISLPHHAVWSYSKAGIPYLNPEIVLLYKAKNTREKDHQDFITVKEHLDNKKKQWLKSALELHVPRTSMDSIVKLIHLILLHNGQKKRHETLI